MKAKQTTKELEISEIPKCCEIVISIILSENLG